MDNAKENKFKVVVHTPRDQLTTDQVVFALFKCNTDELVRRIVANENGEFDCLFDEGA